MKDCLNPQNSGEDSKISERREREMKLNERIKSGDPEALNDLVEDNLGLVVSIANEFKNIRGNMNVSDLIQEGSIALIEAAKKIPTYTRKKLCLIRKPMY